MVLSHFLQRPGPALTRLLDRIRHAVPEGSALPEDAWQRRHRGFLVLLSLHALGLAGFALIRGFGLGISLFSASLPAGAALLAWVIQGRRKLRASIVSLGLLTSSAMLVYISGGYIEMHFHYFVMVTLLALYQDWTPFLLAVGYVAFQHGIGGLLFPHSVYNHPDAWAHPWKWAMIHAAFLAAACVGSLVAWRVNERYHARTELLLNSMAEGLYGLDMDGRIVFANAAAAKLTGYSISELLNQSPHRLLHHSKPDGTPYPQEDCPIHTGLASGEIYSFVDEVYWRKDGTSFPVELRCNPIRDRGILVGATVTFFDITERERDQKNLHLYRKIITDANYAVAILDLEGRFTYQNAAHALLVGYADDELLGKTPAVFLGEENLSVIVKELAKTGSYRGELTGCMKGGVPKNLDLSVFAVNNAAGAPVCYVGIKRDITERIRVERELHASDERFRSVMQSANDGIVIADRNGIVVSWNKGAQRIFGYGEKEVLGHPLTRLMPERYREAHRAGLERVRAGGEIHVIGRTVELHGLRKDGDEFPMELSLAVWVSGEEQFYSSIIRDITERKRLEAQLRQAQKMEGLGRLAGGIAHDFNNLMTVIDGYSHLLQETLSPDAPQLNDVGQIRQAAEKATTLTNQLLAFSRQQVLQLTVLDLNAVVAQISQLLRRLLEENMRLSTLLDPALGRVKADKGQLEQVILNLAVNARDAMPEGGQLTIETRNVGVDKAYAQRHADIPTGQYVMLAVSDTGVGMDAATQANVFEPFFTTKEQGKGTGLGLATVYGIVKQSGGFIWVYSEVGHGTTFKIYLPRVDEAAVPVIEGRTDDKLIAGTETVLVVEDEEMVRALAHRVLKARGYRVLAAGTGEEALRLAEAHRDPIHLLVTDMVMPGMGGQQLAEQLVSRRPETKVLYVSGYTNNAVIRHWMLGAGTAFLQKPYSPASLIRKVREVLDAPE